ncbi:MAG: LysM peptidoglycan-binding domain-containing protein [Acidimicrobiia bacterium]|nr:LysM peptidoglycan-binding domain-containing protein [Acidimicrobiia bacterium]
MLPTPVQECNCDPVVPMFEYEVDDVSSVDRAAAAALFHSLLANPAQDPIPWPSVTNAVMVRPAAPAPEPEPAPEPAPTANATVTVKSGDSLSSIAQEHLGSSQRWNEIFELNKGKPQADGRSLTNQNLLRPGWVLELPS